MEGTGTNYNLSIDISYQYFVQQYKQCNSYKLNMQTVQLDIQIKVRYIFSKMMANELVCVISTATNDL